MYYFNIIRKPRHKYPESRLKRVQTIKYFLVLFHTKSSCGYGTKILCSMKSDIKLNYDKTKEFPHSACEVNHLFLIYHGVVADDYRCKYFLDSQQFLVEELTRVRAPSCPWKSSILANKPEYKFNDMKMHKVTKNQCNKGSRRILGWQTQVKDIMELG